MINEELIKKNIEAVLSKTALYGASLCAVIKNRSNEEIAFAVRECGVKVVGENRVQELLAHHETLVAVGADVHFIGTLQKNKVKYIVDKVSMIESLDSVPLAAEIEKRACKAGKVMDVLVEINIGEEAQKGGVSPDGLSAFLGEVGRFAHLRVRGLMTVAPICERAEEYDAYFIRMKKMFSDFASGYGEKDAPILSMGMSGNYLRALAFGSTEVRVGTGIFGPRIV